MGGNGKYARVSKRVGLRPPINERRTEIELISDSLLPEYSCRDVYKYYCKQYKTRPNSLIMLQLPDTKGSFNLEALELNDNFVGDAGILPILEVARVNKGL